MAEERFPILGKGEILSEPIRVPTGGGKKTPIRTFEEARERLLPQLESLLEGIDHITDLILPDKVFFRVSLDFQYLAKSYFPSTLVEMCGWEMVGSRPWYQTYRDKNEFDEAKLARMLFFSADPIRIESTYLRLKKVTDLKTKEVENFVKIDNVGFHEPKDKLIGFKREFREGVVELIFHPMRVRDWNKCKTKLKRIVSQRKDFTFLWDWKRGEESDPIFLPAVLNHSEVRQLGQFNPLRAARPMPPVSIPRIRKDNIKSLLKPSMGPSLRTIYPEIGIVDGGVDDVIPHLRGWVSNIDKTPQPPDNFFLEHGTAVCGAALYGPCDPLREPNQPKFKVKSFRVFPVPRNLGWDLDLYHVLDWLEDIVQDATNSDIRVYVLSFGPDMPVEDDEVDRFTATLDRLSYEYDVLFFVAAGNAGHLQYPFSRIQPPSDLVNGVGVGAFTYIDGRLSPAPYCCLGPGRPGSQVKPDICGFGGSDEHPFYVLLAGTDGEVVAEQGTSYATPYVASVAGNLLYRSSEPSVVTPQTSKALIIHHTDAFHGFDKARYGWGPISRSPEELMECARNEVKVLYNGFIDLTRWARLRLPFPDGLQYDGRVHFEWTFVYACDVGMETPDDYTLAGIEVIFRPICWQRRIEEMIL